MAFISQSTAILALAVVGALVQAAVTLRLYEPPPPDDAPDARPTPLFEAVLFGVVFGLLYAGVGRGFGIVAGLAPPIGPVLVGVVAAVALAIAYATATGRMGDPDDPSAKALGSAAAATVAVLGATVLVL